MIDDASQEVENPLVTYGQLTVGMQTDSESEDLSQILGGRFKPRAPRGASIQRFQRHMRRHALPLKSASHFSSDDRSALHLHGIRAMQMTEIGGAKGGSRLVAVRRAAAAE
jgi:hypothetical protein